jgi:hypothetical protein
MGQFGAGFGRITNFKPRFLENLKLALVEEGRGLTLHPSRPPVLRTLPPRSPRTGGRFLHNGKNWLQQSSNWHLLQAGRCAF